MTGATTMNQSKDKPITVKKAVKKTSNPDLPSDQVILDTLYAHYGTPENIEKEKVKLYTAYRSPGGWSQDDWIEDGFQMGRVPVFVTHQDDPNDLLRKTKIGSEGTGSWFIGVNATHIKVWIGGKLDTTLKVGD